MEVFIFYHHIIIEILNSDNHHRQQLREYLCDYLRALFRKELLFFFFGINKKKT
jgi:hypothetical protein